MPSLSIQPNADIAFKTRYEDEHIVIVEKPARLVTQPGLAHQDDTLLNGLFSKWGNRLQKLGKERDYGLLHRLDRETSGLLVVALSISAYDGLRAMFESRRIRKFYLALVRDPPNQPRGVIDRPIAEYQGQARGNASGRVGKKKLARVSSSGKEAITAYRVVSRSNLGAMLECRAVTGKLHQIRVHLASIGSPILGDGLYGTEAVKHAAPRLALHAHRLAFDHPVTGSNLDVRSPLPRDMKGVLVRLKLEGPDQTKDDTEGKAE